MIPFALLKPRPRSIITSTAIVWESTLTLSQTSGTYYYYNRNFEYTGTSTSSGCIVNTGSGTARHIFVNCRFRSKSHILRSTAAAGFEFYNCIGQGLDPVVDGQPYGNIISSVVNWLIMENCTWYTIGGIRLNNTNLNYCRGRYNLFINLTGWMSNGTGLPGKAGTRAPTDAYDTSNFVRTSMLQLNGITVAAGGAGTGTGGTSMSEWGWNYNLNEPDASLIADSISLIGGGGAGTGTNRFWIHHNLFNGGYFYNATSQVNTGRAIQHETPGGGHTLEQNNIMTRYHGSWEIYNTFTGSDITLENNQSFFPNYVNGVYCSYIGTPPPLSKGIPLPYATAGSGTDVTLNNNSWTWYTPGYSSSDFFGPPFSGNTGNSATGWTEVGSCSEATADAQVGVWYAAAAAAGLTIGSSLTL